MFSLRSQAIAQEIFATDPGDFFDPAEVTIHVGDIVYWTRENPTTNIHDVTADSSQGDYLGNKCYEPGGLDGYIYQVNIFYHHQFMVAQDCYYRCTLHPPAPGYAGMQGVVHVLPAGGTTTTTTTTLPATTTTTTTTLPNQSPGALISISPCPPVYSNPPCFYPDGESDSSQVIGATIFGGDFVEWVHAALNGTEFTVTASPTQGDYQGHTCPEILNGYLVVHEDTYYHQFTTVGDCYYRSTYQPPDTFYRGYPGMQAVIHVLPSTGPSAFWLMPTNISTLPSVAQTFTAFYADLGGYANLSDSSLTLTGVGISRTEVLHYNQGTNTFTLQGAGGICSPGDSAMLADGYLTLDCSQSSVLLTSGTFLDVTYSLIPQPPMSGYPYLLSTSAMEMGGATRSKSFGSWTVNRPPSVGNTSPMNSTTPVGTLQTFTIVFSDPDGYQNIAAANFYMSGNGGAINQWLHYLQVPNVFTMMGTPDVCHPGQGIIISNGSLSFNCAISTVFGSGTNLTIVFKVTPLTGGINYQFFNAVSDQAGGANAIFAGTWQIP